MTQSHRFNRRQALSWMTILGLACHTTVKAQGPKSINTTRSPVLAQIVDVSTAQIDVTKDFLVGARTGIQEVNARGGLGGQQIRHSVIEVDGSPASLHAAVNQLKAESQCVALFGSAGDQTAAQLVRILAREMPDLPHVAPWLQNVESVGSSNTFPIFASRQEQISHAFKSLYSVGISRVGAVYGSTAEYTAYRTDLEHIGKALKLEIASYPYVGDLKESAAQLQSDTPRVLLFIGGTPELLRFAQGVEKQSVQRYIVAMSDVNLQSVQQLGQISRYTPIIATQVVPMINARIPVVRAFRTALGRFFDEPPTPIGLAGYVAAQYTTEVLRAIDGPLNRANAMRAFGRRNAVDLGGFHIAPDRDARVSSFVTQSMVTADGRLLG